MLALGWGARFRQPSWQLSFVLIAFLFGVAAHSWIGAPLPAEILLIIGLVVLTVGLILLGRRFAIVFFVLSALLFGLARYAISFPTTGSSSVASFIGGEARIEGTIVNDPMSSGERQEVILDELIVNGNVTENKLITYLQRYPELDYDTRISFRCQLDAPKPFDSFAYDRFLLRVGIVATCFSYDEPMIVSAPSFSLRGTIYTLRSAIQTLLNRALPEPESSISAGLLLGIKTLPDKLSADFRKIGVSHIFAASGSNVAMLLLVLTSAVAYIVRRQKAFWFLLGAVVIYIIMAGAEAAVVRAGIMAVTVLLATHSGRATSPRNLILLAAAVMLATNPRLLRDDVGFQLSMLATTGIAVLSTRLNKTFAFIPKAIGLRQAMATTISATLFTLPIMLLNFNQFSLLSPIANLLILPLVPYAMATSAIAALAAAIHPTFGVFVGGLAWGVERLIIVIASVLAAI
ncbi:MAG: ComEC/Rec2 family competence protein [Patescibacteria group bacterium]